MIVSLLSAKLREKQIDIVTSHNFFYTDELDFTTKHEIDRANLFIGIISKSTGFRDRVIQEWNHAKATGIPTILLAENGVRIDYADPDDNIVWFDRNDPNKALGKINKKMKLPSDNTSSAWGWFIAGAIIIGIIQLFSNNED